MNSNKLLFHRIVGCHHWSTAGHLQRRRFSIWLVILWSALFSLGVTIPAGGLSSSDRTSTDHGPPNVSVRMSTSIVESANFQPTPGATQNISASSQHNHQQDDSTKQYPERGSRFFRSQDSLTVREDSWTELAAQQHLRQPMASPNQQQFHHQRQQPALASHSKILDPTQAGYRWSVSTSRNISPQAIQVLASQAGQSVGHTRDKTRPAEHKEAQRGFIRRILDGSHQTILDLRCEGRGVGKMLKSAKNMLQDRMASIEEHSASIPLAVLYSNVVSGGGAGELASPSNRRTSSASSSGVEAPLSFIRHLSLQSRVDSVMGWVERSVEHLPNFPRLHPQECVKRSICEAHNEPNKYGAIGFMLRFLFPATNLSSTDRMDNMEYKVINKYRHAAGFGLNKRIDSNGTNVSACKEKYEDCLISLLDVARNMMDVFLR